MGADEAQDVWLKIEHDMDRFVLEKELTESKYLSLAVWYVNALLGEQVRSRSSVVKTFKQFLLEKYQEQY
jgi:hypothetical protein